MKPNLSKLPPLMLAALLQCAPLLKVVQSTSVMASSPLTIVVQWITAAAVTLGGYHAVSGASTVLITSPTNSVGTNGVNYVYTITQSSAQTDSGHAFTASPLPAGFIVTTFQGGYPAFARITGRPIQFGIWQVRLTATYNDGGQILSALPTNMTLTIYGKPNITNQPVSLTASPGANATFDVTAGGLPAPTYRWRLGTTTLPNQTNSSLTVSNVSASESGDYTVIVSNFLGSVTSEVATLTVQPPLRFTLFERLGGQFRMGFTREAGAAYEIVYSDGLPSAVWQILTNWPPEAASLATAVDVPSHSPATRFYLIRSSSP